MLRYLLIFTFLMLRAGFVSAQESGDRQEFEQRLAELRAQINEDQELLALTRSRETASRRVLNGLDRDIAVRAELVRAFEDRIGTLTIERDSLWSTIQALEAEIETLKSDYRARAVQAYKHGRMSDVASIVSAASINEVLMRVKWFNRFSDTRRRRLDDIRGATMVLSTRKNDLQHMLSQTQETLAQARAEREQLADQRKRRDTVIEDLRSQGSDIERQLAARQQAASDLRDRVAELIAAERRALDRSAGFDIEAFSTLSGSFAENRGRLPWPAPGTMIEPFGEVVNPVYNTRTTNQGVVVATAALEDVRSVFEGRVIIVDVMPEYGTYVVVAHGDYATLYANLSRVLVSVDQAVAAGDPVGLAGTQTEPRGQGYVFGVWDRDGQFVNPSPWLAGR